MELYLHSICTLHHLLLCFSDNLTLSCEERENQQDAVIRCLLSNSVSTCFGHHYAHLQDTEVDNKHLFVASCWFSLSSHFARDALSQEPKAYFIDLLDMLHVTFFGKLISLLDVPEIANSSWNAVVGHRLQ